MYMCFRFYWCHIFFFFISSLWFFNVKLWQVLYCKILKTFLLHIWRYIARLQVNHIWRYIARLQVNHIWRYIARLQVNHIWRYITRLQVNHIWRYIARLQVNHIWRYIARLQVNHFSSKFETCLLSYLLLNSERKEAKSWGYGC
jgi:hypothetical protein